MEKIVTPNWEAWDIKYLSPSHINKYNGSKSSWVAHYVHGIKEKGLMTAAVRGQAAEYGIEKALEGADVAGAIIEAERHFHDRVAEVEDELNIKIPSSLYMNDYNLVADYVKQGIDLYKKMISNNHHVQLGLEGIEYVESTEADRKVVYDLDDLNIQMYGFYDFKFKANDKVFRVDNKSTKYMPPYVSDIDKKAADTNDGIALVKGKPEHRMQAAYYATALGEDVAGIGYQSNKRHGLTLMNKDEINDEYNKMLNMVESIATTLHVYETAANGDIEKARYFISKAFPVTVDQDSFYWSNKEYLQECKDKIKGWN